MKHLFWNKKWKRRLAASLLPVCMGIVISTRFFPLPQPSTTTSPSGDSMTMDNSRSSTPSTELICDDSVDNDNDTLVDCGDFQDCALAANCEEICDNELDDDLDGAVDCDDLWCEYDPAC
jgi:hypothetical protein